MSNAKYRVATIPGDGIGREVIPAAVDVLTCLSEKFDFKISWENFDWSSKYYLAHGKMMPLDGLDKLSEFDSIFLGAVGTPEIPDDVTLWGLLIPIRRTFDQYINLRPIRSFEGIEGPLKNGKHIDLIIIRENVEGEYSTVGGRYYEKTPFETALQSGIFTRRGIERVSKYALQLALTR